MSIPPNTLSEREAEFYMRAAYFAFLGREGESPYLQQWANRIAESDDLVSVLQDFLAGEEYRRRPIADAGLSERIAPKQDKAASGSRQASLGLLRRAATSAGRRSGYAFAEDLEPIQDEIARHLRVLYAWSAHNSLGRPAQSAPPNDAKEQPTLNADAMLKDQLALNYRLLSLEETVVRIRSERDEEVSAALHKLESELARLSEESRERHETGLRLETELGRLSEESRERHETMLRLEPELVRLSEESRERHETMLRLEPEIASLRDRITAGTPAHPRVLAIEDAGVNLSRGPYGNFLTIVPDLVGGTIEKGEFWDPHLRPIFERYANPERVALDVGAYIGFHTVFLSERFKTVHAFEPQARCFRLLNANVELNRCDNVVTYQRAIYDQSGIMSLAPSEVQQVPLAVNGGRINYSELGNAASLAFIPGGGAGELQVPSINIDSLELRDVALIKIDAQGCDLRVLKGAEQTVRRCRPVITFEFEEKLAALHGDTLPAFEAFIAGLDYELTQLIHPSSTQQDFLARPRELA